MSTINVDNIAEYTSSGKINATHDIKMASGKKVLNSDGHEVGAMVLLGSETLSSTFTLPKFFDKPLISNNSISYFFY